MDWRHEVRDKLMSPEEAVRDVRSGDQVVVAFFHLTPFTLCQALYDRRSELEKVRIDHPAPFFPWRKLDEESPFELYDAYATPADRDLVNSGQASYIPAARWRAGEAIDGFVQNPDAFLLPVSPPFPIRYPVHSLPGVI